MDFQILRILVLMLVPFSLAQSTVNNTYYPPKGNIAIYIDATDMAALNVSPIFERSKRIFESLGKVMDKKGL
jgi:hypothetical protein